MGSVANKYRVHEVAKDFGIATKDITEILTKYAETPKNHMQVLEDRELSLIFEYLTQHNQISSIATIFAEGAKPEEKKPEEKKPEEKKFENKKNSEKKEFKKEHKEHKEHKEYKEHKEHKEYKEHKEVKKQPQKKEAVAEVKEEKKEIEIAVVTEETMKICEEFLIDVLKAMGMEGVEILSKVDEDGALSIEMKGDNMGILIGKRGQTLDSLQYLTNRVANKSQDGYVRVKLDTEDYRRRRKQTLENLAKNIAFKVKRTKRSFALEPMNPYERRIIHSTLQNDKYVATKSEGEEPYRKVIVYLKKYDRR